MHWEAELRDRAAAQGGAVGIDQLRRLSCTGDEWGRARRSLRWCSPSRRVLTLAGSPESDEQRVHVALLDAGAGAVLHGESALAWCGLRGHDLRQVHVARRRETTRTLPRLCVLHRLRDLDDRDIVVVRGVRTLSPLRAIWCEASRYGPRRLFAAGLRRIGRLLDDAHRAGLVTWADLHHSVDRLGRRGRSGTRVMRALAAERSPGSSPTESRQEDRLESILRRARRRAFERQVVVGARSPIGRVDFKDPDAPVIAEVNSLTFHSTPSDRAADEKRYQRLLRAGFSVAVIWEPDLWSATNSVVRVVDEARHATSAGRPTVLHSPGCPWPPDPKRTVLPRRRPPSRG